MSKTEEIKQVSETSKTEEQTEDNFKYCKTLINKIKKDKINLSPPELSPDLKNLNFKIDIYTKKIEHLKLKPESFKQVIDIDDDNDDDNDDDDKNICSVCFGNKATIQCKKCRNYPVCTDCINNLSSRDIYYTTDEYLRDHKHIYKYNPYDIHKISFDCPLCRSNNLINLTDPNLSKDDLIKLIYKESLDFGRRKNELYQCKKIISGGGYYEYEHDCGTHIDEYANPGFVVDGYIKNYTLTIEENERLKRANQLRNYRVASQWRRINKQEREIKALNDEIKALKDERFKLCVENEIKTGYAEGLSLVIDKYKNHIKQSFQKLKSLTPKKRAEFIDIITNTKYDLNINLRLNGDDTARFECVPKILKK